MFQDLRAVYCIINNEIDNISYKRHTDDNNGPEYFPGLAEVFFFYHLPERKKVKKQKDQGSESQEPIF